MGSANIVLDTNQVGPFLNFVEERGWPSGYAAVVLTPHVVAELAQGARGVDHIHRLEDLPLVLGMQPAEAFDTVARLDEAGVRSFAPLYDRHAWAPLKGQLATIATQNREEARATKARGQNHTAGFLAASANAQAKLKLREGGKIRKFAHPADALSALMSPADASWFVADPIINRGERQPQMKEPRELTRACLANPYLGRFFRQMGFYMLVS